MEYYKNLDLKDIVYINDEGVECIEQWKDIKGFEGYYQVSDLGRIKSLNRVVNRGEHSYNVVCKIRRQVLLKNGYLTISLTIGGERFIHSTHVLVAVAFLNHKPDGFKRVVDHKNDIKTDNRLSNLQITTNRYNTSKNRAGSSKYTGVSLVNSGKWESVIQIEGVKHILGYFILEEDASDAYQKALSNWLDFELIPPIYRNPNRTSKHKYIYISNNKWAVNYKRNIIGYYLTEQEAYEALCKYKNDNGIE